MEFRWDERKRISNLRKHGIDFRDVATVFAEDTVLMEDDASSMEKPASSHWDCFEAA